MINMRFASTLQRAHDLLNDATPLFVEVSIEKLPSGKIHHNGTATPLCTSGVRAKHLLVGLRAESRPNFTSCRT